MNCSATVSQYIAQRFDKPRAQAIFRTSTASSPSSTAAAAACSTRACSTRSSTARSPAWPTIRISAATCSSASAASKRRCGYLLQSQNLVQIGGNGSPRPAGPPVLSMQDLGGTAKTVEAGVRLLAELLPRVNDVRREPIPASEIMLGTNCGGSDGNSGVTCNPALGVASDMLVACGGTSRPGRNDRNLWRRAPAHAAGRQRRRRRQAARAHQVVALAHRPVRRRDRQQPVGRQQGRRPDDDRRKVARRRRQSRLAPR